MPSRDVNAVTRLAESSWRRDNNQCLSETKNSKSLTTLTPRPPYYIVNRVIKGMSFKPVR